MFVLMHVWSEWVVSEVLQPSAVCSKQQSAAASLFAAVGCIGIYIYMTASLECTGKLRRDKGVLLTLAAADAQHAAVAGAMEAEVRG